MTCHLAEEELVGEEGVLPGEGGGEQLGVADVDLLPRQDPPHRHHAQQQTRPGHITRATRTSNEGPSGGS